MNRTFPIVIVSTFALGGCLSQTSEGPGPKTEFEREIDASLDGIEYRLRRMRSADEDIQADGTIEELRLHREELRNRLNELIDEQAADSDSTERDLRRLMEDLAIRYETARLGRFEDRKLFEEAVEVRFDDLDRELAVLEAQIFQSELQIRFEGPIARLYRLRNDVALRIAETAVASDQEFPRLRSELAAAIGKLDITLAHTMLEVDRAYEAKHPIRSLNKLWL